MDISNYWEEPVYEGFYHTGIKTYSPMDSLSRGDSYGYLTGVCCRHVTIAYAGAAG